MDNRHIVIFDGICVFCSGSVKFIIERDPHAKFVFTPMQSELANTLIKQHGVDNVGVDTFLLIKDGKTYTRTDAALEIAKDLSGFWYLCTGFKIVPRFFRDYLYRLFARNRYNLFGKHESCMVPDEKVKERFMGI